MEKGDVTLYFIFGLALSDVANKPSILRIDVYKEERPFTYVDINDDWDADLIEPYFHIISLLGLLYWLVKLPSENNYGKNTLEKNLENKR